MTEKLVDVEQAQFEDQVINVQEIYDSLVETGAMSLQSQDKQQHWRSGDDTFYGDAEADYVETGGGSDRIMSRAAMTISLFKAKAQ